MAYFTLYPNDDTVLKSVREALPKNPHVAVEGKRTRVPYYWRYRVKLPTPVKMIGVAIGKGGLIFTFADGTRHTLGYGDKVSIVVKKEVELWKCDPYKARVSFTDIEGKKVILTLKY